MLSGFSQKIQVLDKSSFTHDYLLGPFTFIEDTKDTSGMKYIATLSVSSSYSAVIVEQTYSLLKMKSKELGANCYLISRFAAKDTSVQLTLKIFFAFESFFKFNENKKQKDSAFIFSSYSTPSGNQYFYANDSLISFPTETYYRLNPTKKKIALKACPKAKMQFFVLVGSTELSTSGSSGVNLPAGEKKNSQYLLITSNRFATDNLNPFKPANKKCGNIVAMGYDSGRFVKAVFDRNKK
jgi:hypothetical protein